MATVKELKEKSKAEKQEMEQEDMVSTEQLEKLENQTEEPKAPEGIKLTDAELRLLTDLERKKGLVKNEINFLANQRLIIDYRQVEAEKMYRDNLELEKQLGEALTSKYGNGAADLVNGVFIPQ